MSEAIAKVEIKTKSKPKPAVRRFKIELVKPSDICDVWALYHQSMQLAPQPYPSLEEELPATVRSHVFTMISQPNFLGAIARVGRRPVGQLNGFVTHRPYGAPRVFFQFWMSWVDPQFRKSEAARGLLNEVFKTLKANGIYHFESIIDPSMVAVMEKVYGGQLQVVSHRIVGKVKAE